MSYETKTALRLARDYWFFAVMYSGTMVLVLMLLKHFLIGSLL